MLIATEQTTCTKKELCKAIIQAWILLYNETPIKASVGIITSQHDIETGAGASCYNWNLGNVKYVAANGNVPYIALKGVWEIINGKKVFLDQSDPGSWFRAFPTLLDGAKFHLQFIKNNRYASAWPAIEMGNVTLFATILREKGYYTAPLNDYIAGMNRYFLAFMQSPDYENALAELQAESRADDGRFVAPHLQPWITLGPPEPPPMGELTVLPEINMSVASPRAVGSFSSGIKSLFGSVSKWLKKS